MGWLFYKPTREALVAHLLEAHGDQAVPNSDTPPAPLPNAVITSRLRKIAAAGP